MKNSLCLIANSGKATVVNRRGRGFVLSTRRNVAARALLSGRTPRGAGGTFTRRQMRQALTGSRRTRL